MLDKTDIYDKKEIYKEEIAPAVRELQKRCSLNKLPMFVSVAVANSEEGTEYRNTMILAGVRRELKDNRIGRLLLKLNGIGDEGYPDWVRQYADALEEYLVQAAGPGEKEEVPGLELKDDTIPGLAAVYTSQDKGHAPRQEEKENGS